MIAEKLIPSFYMIEVEGAATKGVVHGDHGIEKIHIGSSDFANDMMALAGMNDAMRNILKAVHLEDIKADISYNPEFFPTLKPIEPTEEQKVAQEAMLEKAEELRHEMMGQGKAVVPITELFDPLGDFVEARWTVETAELKVEGKVAINPQYYILEKHRDTEGYSLGTLPKPQKKITVH